MNTEAKREFIRKTYGDYFKGKLLNNMPEKQVHTVYFRLVNEINTLRNRYIAKYHYSKAAIDISGRMSLFELRDALKENGDKNNEGYQYTLFDWQQELEGKEQEKEWQREQSTENAVM